MSQEEIPFQEETENTPVEQPTENKEENQASSEDNVVELLGADAANIVFG